MREEEENDFSPVNVTNDTRTGVISGEGRVLEQTAQLWARGMHRSYQGSTTFQGAYALPSICSVSISDNIPKEMQPMVPLLTRSYHT